MSSPAPSLLRNVTTLISAQVVIKVINFGVSLAVIRYLGAQELGRYAYILAFAYPFGALADFGFATYAIREISRNPARKLVVLAFLQRALLLFTGGSVAGMLGLAICTGHELRTVAGITLAGLSTMLSACTTPSLVVLKTREDFHLVSLQQIVACAVAAGVTMLVLFWGGASLELLAGATVGGGAMFIFARFLVGDAPSLPPVSRVDLQRLVRQAMPFGLSMIGFALYYRIDMVMLHWLRGEAEVGIYSAGYRFLDAVLILAAALGGPFYPRLSSMVERDPQGIRTLLESLWKPMLALTLPLVLLCTFVADPLSITLFGEEFADTGRILKILIWGSVPMVLIAIPNHALNAADLALSLARVYGVSLVVNIIANFLLIPTLGAAGAAISTTLCEWLTLCLVVGLIRRRFSISLSGEGLWRYLLAAAGMAAALWMTQGSGLIVESVAGLLAYAGALLALGYLRSTELLAVKRLLAP